jgi:hypothetical protein
MAPRCEYLHGARDRVQVQHVRAEGEVVELLLCLDVAVSR